MAMAVEKHKATLAQSKKLRSSVDWLTEATFRLTDAWLNKRDFSTVSMKTITRLRKVSCAHFR